MMMVPGASRVGVAHDLAAQARRQFEGRALVRSGRGFDGRRRRILGCVVAAARKNGKSGACGAAAAEPVKANVPIAKAAKARRGGNGA